MQPLAAWCFLSDIGEHDAPKVHLGTGRPGACNGIELPRSHDQVGACEAHLCGIE